MLTRGFAMARAEGADTLPYLVERLLELDDGHAVDVYRVKLEAPPATVGGSEQCGDAVPVGRGARARAAARAKRPS